MQILDSNDIEQFVPLMNTTPLTNLISPAALIAAVFSLVLESVKRAAFGRRQVQVAIVQNAK